MGKPEAQRILLTGARLPFTLDLARQFKAAGHSVVAADPWKHHFCRYSNAVEKSVLVPSPRKDPLAFTAGLARVCREEKIDLLIPTFEEVLYVSQSIDQFPDATKVFCSPFDQMLRLHNKWRFYNGLSSLGIPTPKTYLIENEGDLAKIKFDGDYAFKSCYSRAAQAVYKVEAGQTPPEVTYDPANPWIAQEWLYGQRYCTYSVCCDGQVQAHSCYPVEYAIDGHYCLTFRAVRHKAIREWVENFIAHEKYTGQIGFDFFEIPGRGLLAIEANPRTTHGVCLFEPDDGIDQAFFSNRSTPLLPKEGLARQIFCAMVGFGWKGLPKERGWWAYLKSIAKTPDVIFRRADPKPFLMQLPMGFAYHQKAKKLGIPIPDAATWDSDWNGH